MSGLCIPGHFLSGLLLCIFWFSRFLTGGGSGEGKLVIEHILLYYPGKPLVTAEGKSVRIKRSQNLFHMGIHRKSADMVEAVQTDTVSHLTSDAKFSHQDCLRPIIIRLLQGSQEFLSGAPLQRFAMARIYLSR